MGARGHARLIGRVYDLSNRNPNFFGERLPSNRFWRIFPEFRKSIAYWDMETTDLNSWDNSYFRKNRKVLLITSGQKSQNRDDSMAPVSTQEEQDSAFFCKRFIGGDSRIECKSSRYTLPRGCVWSRQLVILPSGYTRMQILGAWHRYLTFPLANSSR